MSSNRNRPAKPHGPRQGSTGRGHEHRLRVESIASGGEGVGHLEDGRAVFVHRTAPGDLAEIRLVHQQKRWARGRLLRILEPSPDRREPDCPHYRDCGGCTLEHMTYEAQLRAKARIVADALQRIGGLDVAIPEVVPSPREHRYRNRVSFSLRRLGAGQVVAGFHVLNDPDRIVAIDGRCLLPEEPIAAVWDRIRERWGPDANRLPSGERLRLTLRGTATGAVSLLVEGGFAPGRLPALVEAVEGLVAAWHRPGRAPATLIAGTPGLSDSWADETVDVSGSAFLQVNREAAALLDDHVLALVGDPAGKRILDAYCGVGVHARRLARSGASVIGLELDPEAVAAARAADSTGAEFEEGDVAELLPRLLPADLVILNPPRGGLTAAVTDALVAVPPSHVLYVSCNPATLARDLRRLEGAFRLASVRCFDLFPQTAHVETVVHLKPHAPALDSSASRRPGS